jgi:hypothetical protein
MIRVHLPQVIDVSTVTEEDKRLPQHGDLLAALGT